MIPAPRIYRLTVLLLLGATFAAHGQQLGQFSQYMQNMYVLNPAAAGVNHQTDINLSYRRQWTGIENAPTVYYVTASTPLGKEYKKPNYRASSTRISRPQNFKDIVTRRKAYHGVGGMVAMHEVGAFKKTFGNLSYAVHVPFSKTFTMGFGASAGLSNHSFDQSKFDVNEPLDLTYVNFISGGTSTTVLDINFGMIGYTESFYFGYSAAQLLQNDLSFGENPDDLETAIDLHHYIITGYRKPLNANYTITPSILFKYASPSPASFDLNVKVDYQDRIWGAFSYRHNAALVLLVGASFNNKLRFGYSYDYSISSLRDFNSGSHEIFLGLMLNKRRKIAF
ncbi:MAG: type IX secretion system membrane protein PorP/SprF [Bacteroidota bacterium]